MNKKLTTVTAAATTTLVGLASTNVIHAEEVKPVETPVEAVETTKSQEVTQEQLNEAVTERDNNAEEVSKAEAAVENAEAVVGTANAEVERLEDEVAKGESATPEAIEQAKTEAEEAGKDEQAKAEKVSEAEEAVKPVAEAKADAEKEEAEAKAEADKATKDLADVEAEKALVEKALDPKAVEQAEKEAEQAKKDVENKTADLDTAKVSLEDAKAKDVETQKAVEQAKADMDAKLADKTAKDTKAIELKAVSDNAKAELDKALAPKYNGISTNIPLTQEFVDAFKAWMEFRKNSQDLLLNNYAEYKRQDNQHKKNVLDAEKKTVSEMKDLYVLENNEWKYYMSINPNGNTEMEELFKRLEREVKTEQRYDVSNLSDSMRLELSQYAVDVFNTIRSQFGLNALKVNTNAMNFAKDVANIVERDNYSTMGHYVNGIKEVAGKYGVNTNDNYYENLMSSNFSNMLTKNELFAIMADAIRSFFYEGTNGNPNYGHARSLYEMESGVGFDFSVTKDGDRNVVKLHMISVPLTTTTKSDFDARWSLNSPASISSTSDDVSALRDAYNQALANYAKAQGEATSATTLYDIAKRVYNEKLAIPMLTPDATTRVTNAQAALDNAVAVEAVATKKVADLKELAKNGKERLEDLKLATLRTREVKEEKDLILADKVVIREEMTKLYNEAMDTLKVAKANYDEAKEATIKANQKVADLETARDNLLVNRQALAEARANLVDAQANLNKAKAVLVEAKAKAKIAYDKWHVLNAQYTVEEAMRQAERERIEAEKAKELEKAKDAEKAKAAEKAKTEEKEKRREQTKTKTEESKLVESVVNSTVNKGAALPNTGEVSVLPTVFEGLALLAAGYSTLRRKRKQ